MNSKKQHSCIILCGGQSRRMGQDKGSMIIQDKPMINHILSTLNNEINELLDKADYIKDAYFLEVSSPGIERVLRKDKHLKQNIGKEICVKLFKKDENGKKEYTGILNDFDQETIKVEIEKQIQEIQRKNIAQIKTVYNW